MRSALKTFFASAVLALGVISCGRHAETNDAQTKVDTTGLQLDVTVEYASTNHLDWASVNWNGGKIEVGVMPPGKSATQIDVGLPLGTKTNTAIIEFINEDAPGLGWASGSNEEVRARRAKASTLIPVDAGKLLKLGPGHYEATFRILSLTNAEVQVKKR